MTVEECGKVMALLKVANEMGCEVDASGKAISVWRNDPDCKVFKFDTVEGALGFFVGLRAISDKTGVKADSEGGGSRPVHKSETSLCRKRLARYCVGDGLDIGYGGDPILPSAITVDLPNPYTNVGSAPQHLHGDAKNLCWFRDGVLDYVFSSHLLEDFTADEMPVVLGEWLRVLKPSGLLVLYLPDQKIYAEHCRRTGQDANKSHKVGDFSLDFLKKLLDVHFKGRIKIVHERPLVDTYSFEIVISKLYST